MQQSAKSSKTNLNHGISHIIILKALQLELQNRGEIKEKNALLCILRYQDWIQSLRYIQNELKEKRTSYNWQTSFIKYNEEQDIYGILHAVCMFTIWLYSVIIWLFPISVNEYIEAHRSHKYINNTTVLV